MKKEIIKDGETVIIGNFDKTFENDLYQLFFNTKTGFEVLKGKDGVDPFMTDLPLLLDIGIMGSCLNKCPFCYQGHEEEPHMKLEDFKTIIDQVKHHTNQVALGGRGDPNNHPNFKEIVEYARENDVVPNYTTSGINLTDEQIEISKICGAVAVSDYGKDFTFNALSRLIDAGIKTNIHLIFSRKSFSKSMSLLEGYDVWDGQVDHEKLNAVVLLLFKPQGCGKYHQSLIPTKDQLKTFSSIALNPRTKFKIGMDSCLLNHILTYEEPTKIQSIALDTCESSRMSVYISPSMHLIPCSFADHLKWGVKITEENTIHDIWNNSTEFKKFREKIFLNPTICPAGL